LNDREGLDPRPNDEEPSLVATVGLVVVIWVVLLGLFLALYAASPSRPTG
jgi:hypothetical protein